jgi:hypothetical protein
MKGMYIVTTSQFPHNVVATNVLYTLNVLFSYIGYEKCAWQLSLFSGIIMDGVC